MKRSTFATLAAALALATTPQLAHAGHYCWGGTVRPYGSTTAGSYATLGLGGVQTDGGPYNGGLHPWCQNRFAINKADTAIWSMVMAAWLTGKRIGLCYSDEATDGVSAHGTYNGQCKVWHTYPID